MIGGEGAGWVRLNWVRAGLRDGFVPVNSAGALAAQHRGRGVRSGPGLLRGVRHVPGWNTATARLVLDELEDIPILHFGDLDPKGAEIVSHLRKHYPRLRWVIPSFWHEYVPDRAHKQAWPDDIDLTVAPALVHELKDSQLWLEQETIVLDPRLPIALDEEVQ